MFFQKNGYYVYKVGNEENTFILEVNGNKIRGVYDDDTTEITNIKNDFLKVEYSEVENSYTLRKTAGQCILQTFEIYDSLYFENKEDIVIEIL